MANGTHPRIIPLPGGVPASEPFAARVAREGDDFTRTSLDVLQVNLGKLCNQACHHCHVDAGPTRTEIMTRETVDAVLEFLTASDAPTVDLTGGAPELNPHFRYLVGRCRALGRTVMVRCNLTVLFVEGQTDLPEFYRDHRVQLVCSLPCYAEENVDAQRGKGVYDASIEALRRLNAVGYGRPGTGLLLDLVYNPVGPTLPPPQAALEADYHRELKERFGIVFNRLYTITNMPIHRFAAALRREGALAAYLHTLHAAFNAATLPQVMCRTLVSVGWEGTLYDCDFNQMLEMPLEEGGTGDPRPLNIQAVTPQDLLGRRILVDDHCYGCTAGAGSSCGGALA